MIYDNPIVFEKLVRVDSKENFKNSKQFKPSKYQKTKFKRKTQLWS